MIRSVATLLLLLQLRPFAGAAVCLHQSLAGVPACEMAMRASATDRESLGRPAATLPVPRSASDCPLAQLCAIPAGAVLSIQPRTTVGMIEVPAAVPSYTNTLVPADPAAPLVPPPNS